MAEYKIIATRLNIRREPNQNGLIVGVLSQHDIVEVTNIQNGWGMIDRGWVSMRYLQPASMPLTLADCALSIARSQIGVAEHPKGSNWGPVEKYLRSVNIGFPAAWCMAFVYWCVDKASKELRVDNPLYRTGGVLAQWNASRILRADRPKKGDIFIMEFGRGLGHAGFVDSVQGDRIQTIEGNSNDEGSREGYEVCRKPGGRPITSCKGFLRI